MDVRPIDANVLIKSLRGSFKELKNLCLEETDEAAKELREAQMVVFVDVILRTEHAPTINLAPVVHGEWIEVFPYKNNPQTTLFCSVCGVWQPIYEHDNWDFCPFCGAKMDGGKTNGRETC